MPLCKLLYLGISPWYNYVSHTKSINVLLHVLVEGSRILAYRYSYETVVHIEMIIIVKMLNACGVFFAQWLV